MQHPGCKDAGRTHEQQTAVWEDLPRPKMGPIPVILEDGDIDINQEMLNAGFGEKRFTAHSPHGPGKPGSYPGGDRPSKWMNEPSRRSPPAQSGMETFSRMGTFNEQDVTRWLKLSWLNYCILFASFRIWQPCHMTFVFDRHWLSHDHVMWDKVKNTCIQRRKKHCEVNTVK